LANPERYSTEVISRIFWNCRFTSSIEVFMIVMESAASMSSRYRSLARKGGKDHEAQKGSGVRDPTRERSYPTMFLNSCFFFSISRLRGREEEEKKKKKGKKEKEKEKEMMR